MQVEAEESKLLLLETFSLFFFTRASSRGARAPKKDTSAFLMIFSYIQGVPKKGGLANATVSALLLI